jgi:hypothetical protein
MAKGTVITSVRDVIAVASDIIEAAETNIAWLIPAYMLVYSSQFSLVTKSRALIQKGGRARGITAISPPYVEEVRGLLDIGEDVRHVGHYQEIFMLVNDKGESVSSINTGTEDISLDNPIVAYWTDDPTYAEYLRSSFEMAWEQSTDAAERIREVL